MKGAYVALAFFGLAAVLFIMRWDEAASQRLYVLPGLAFFILGVLAALASLITLLARRAWDTALVPALALLVVAPIVFFIALVTGFR